MAFNPFFGGRLEAALRAAEAATGQRRSIISAERTPEEQAQLYADYSGRTYNYGGVTYSRKRVGGLAARPPGFEGAPGSRHQIGEAVDLGPGAVRNWVMANASQFGLEGLGAQDPNHLQLARGITRTPYDPAGQGYSRQAIYQGGGGGAASAFSQGSDTGFVLPADAPAGMRNNNPLNIKYYAGAPYAGLVGPSENTDQGDPQMKFATPEHGWSAAYQLLAKKYAGGKLTANDIIAGQGGWTPGNFQAAANVARTAGISPTEDIRFTDPARAKAFMRGLVTQEQGSASKAYSDAMIEAAIAGKTPNLGPNTLVPGTSMVVPREQLTPPPAASSGSGGSGSGGGETQPPPDIPDLGSLFSGIGSAVGSGGGGGYNNGGLSYNAADMSPAVTPDLQTTPASIPANVLDMPWLANERQPLAPLADLFTVKTIGQPASKLKAMQMAQMSGMAPSSL